jgi:phage FluMu protein Com
MEQDLNKNQVTESNFDPMEEEGIKYHIKNVEGEPRKSIRDEIHKQLDAEKAAYLFDADEVAQINNDLEEVAKKPYGENYSDEDYRFLEENQQALNDVMMATVGEDRYGLKTSELKITKKGNDFVVKEHSKDERIKKDRDELNNIAIGIANQKNLSKIWVVDEKFGIEEAPNITEEEAFNKAIKDPTEPKDSDFYKYRKFDTSSEKCVIRCPLCKGKMFFKVLLEIKCPRCKGTGRVNIAPKEYYAYLEKELKNIQRRQQLQQDKPNSRVLVFEDKKSISF